MPYTEIAYEVADGVATITLDRPAKLNAFTTTMADEIVAAFDATDADPGVRVVVVTGRGRGFCAGADLGRGASTFDSSDGARAADQTHGTVDGVPRDRGGVTSLRIAASRKPVIGAINGPAVGIGATMTLPMDVRIAAESARFGFVFARRGLVPEAASSWFLPRVVGISRAMEWVATGRVFDAAEALAGGLVSRVVPDADLADSVRALAAEIVDNTSAVSVAVSRQLLWSMLGAPGPWEAHRLDSRAIDALGRGPDAAEGVTSFLEKRAPAFPGQVPADYPDIVPPWPPHTS
ncbi:MAG: enoyl-CoA hydratase/isomerase family protein [Pseudonocardia sp.]|uniref:enoyl-CoA hydratase-related protein n=1 Tax=unclassified Pseudonocardia TaxID=2619320 RepID=UPI00086DBED3|nr:MULTISPECIES: enoyl-CoA hydratase-related protein [unclassified Pseudonocardia]MBN9108476.1 enoyl-CoA hydratase/isomerase family protein [Pseudonocardia sp.]ODU23108.1 MAG: enoyl-CoA hydratase [Pseudonocardia sp. SCN 72-51]ODV07866.1 MAG: enoyl-CoA hydratase [Pseudonocardia sp. SCN 73-27]